MTSDGTARRPYLLSTLDFRPSTLDQICSFNLQPPGPPVLYYAVLIPEPAMLALAGMGMLSLLAFRFFGGK